MTLSCTLGVQVGYQIKILLWKSGEVLEQAAQGGGGVTIPGGFQEEGKCGTK